VLLGDLRRGDHCRWQGLWWAPARLAVAGNVPVGRDVRDEQELAHEGIIAMTLISTRMFFSAAPTVARGRVGGCQECAVNAIEAGPSLFADARDRRWCSRHEDQVEAGAAPGIASILRIVAVPRPAPRWSHRRLLRVSGS